MDLLAKARQLESNIARRLDRAARDLVHARARDPLEIAHAVADAVEEQIQPGGRGARVFPFTHVAVSVVAASDLPRARFQAVFETEPTLRDRIVERLQAAGCHDARPVVTVEYVSRAPKHWKHPDVGIRFSRLAEAPAAVAADETPAARIELTVSRGAAERRSYSFAALRIDIGRCREVRDSRHRLIRVNDVAFTEGGDAVNQTVSRQHAHIVHDEVARVFRLQDDGSAQGSAIVRAGRTVTVPRGARGVRLQAGDEIVLGEARIRVRFVESAGS